jgi:ABC-2 type transport system ATP-binding protein
MCTAVGIIDRGRLLRSGRIADIERSLRANALLRIDVVGEHAALTEWLGTQPGIADVMLLDDAPQGISRIEATYDGSPDAQAALLREMIAAGHPVSAFTQAASDLEEIFLKVTGRDDEEEAA